MVRKLALAVSLALGTVSVPAHALGLGELSSKSTLNQNFNGDIALLSVDPDEIASVRVKLADPDAFARAGVERPFYLSLLKFDPIVDARGKPVVRVSSEFPIREPFLNFLVEVNWPKGRLLREYTVLLDPPTTTRRRAPVVQPAKRAEPAQARKAVAAPAAKPVQPQPASRPTAATSGEYGPVRANDTAWSIASRLRPSGVSMSQMMMALLDANPHAFINNDINRLRRGRILRVPSLDEVRNLSRAEAAAAYRAQQDQWLARRDAKVQDQAAAELPKPPAKPSPQLTAPVVADAPPPDKLRIATARPEGQGEAGSGDDNAAAPAASDLKARLIAARENAESSRQEAETLRTQVDDLQERLKNMQRLLSLKDDQLAQLQDRVVGEDAAGVETPAVELPLPAGTTDEVVMGNQIVIEDAPSADTQGASPDTTGETMSDVAADAADRVDAVSRAVDDAVADLMAGDATPAANYRIAEIPPQIDPDRIVMSGGSVGPAVPAESAMPAQLVQSTAPAARLDLDIPQQIDPDRIVLGLDTPAVESVIPDVPDTTVISAAPEGGPDDITIGGPGGDLPVDEPVIDSVPAAIGSAPSMEVAGSDPQPGEPGSAISPPAADDAPLIDPALSSMVEKNIVPIAAAGVGLLGLLGWLFTRRRREEQGSDEAVAMAAAGAASISTASAGADTRRQAAVDEPILDPDALADLPDSSFLDDFTPSDINALQDETGEVDPVSEADVYIAYGRYQQAEELLKQAMSRDPDRLALKHKLLEVHYATRNAEAFSALAQEMVDGGQESVDEDAWARARDMGRELAPGHELFVRDDDGPDWKGTVAATAAVVGAAAATGKVDSDTLSLEDLELSELNAAYEEEPSALYELDSPSEVSVTLDLEDDSSTLTLPPQSEAPQAVSLDDLEPLEFEMPDSDKDDGSITLNADDPITDTLDLDSMMAEAEAAVDQGESSLGFDSDFSAAELQAQLDELSDLSALDSELDEVTAAAVPEGLGLVSEDRGPGETGLDAPVSLDTAFDADVGDDESLDSLDLTSSPTDGDEVGTKLDLARAYVEMGDQDGARSILEEVVVEGNSAQRDDAEKLLAQLG